MAQLDIVVGAHLSNCKKDILGMMYSKHCKKNVARYAMPYEIEFRDSLPKTLVGKVAYRVLEEEELSKIEK